MVESDTEATMYIKLRCMLMQVSALKYDSPRSRRAFFNKSPTQWHGFKNGTHYYVRLDSSKNNTSTNLTIDRIHEIPGMNFLC